MTQPIVITQKVLSVIRALPASERESVVNALARHLFLDEPAELPSSMQRIVYALITGNIARDSRKAVNDSKSLQANLFIYE